jgi:hypothetical protein
MINKTMQNPVRVAADAVSTATLATAKDRAAAFAHAVADELAAQDARLYRLETLAGMMGGENG